MTHNNPWWEKKLYPVLKTVNHGMNKCVTSILTSDIVTLTHLVPRAEYPGSQRHCYCCLSSLLCLGFHRLSIGYRGYKILVLHEKEFLKPRFFSLEKWYKSNYIFMFPSANSRLDWKLHFPWLIALLLCHLALAIPAHGIHKADTNAIHMQQRGIIAAYRLGNPERRKKSASSQ